jgi:SAM-dependent methyltransferase
MAASVARVGVQTADDERERPEAVGSKDRPPCPLCGERLPEPTLTGIDRLFGVPGRFHVSVCVACGAGVTVPVLEPEALPAFYPPEYGTHEAVSGRTRSLVRSYRGWRDRVMRPTPPLAMLWNRPPGSLLDVGCGKGGPSAPLRRRGWRIVGLDPSSEACGVARERGIEARVGTLQTARLEESFDAVLFNHSLEHVADPVNDLSRASHLLREEGLLLLAVPNFGCWQRKLFEARWLPLDLPRHRTHFTQESLGATLERCGFVVRSLSTHTTLTALPLSLQFVAFGRPLFRGAISRRLMVVAYVFLFPLSLIANSLGRGGDVLTAVASVRPRR